MTFNARPTRGAAIADARGLAAMQAKLGEALSKAYPTRVDRVYAAAAGLLAGWGIVISLAAAFADADTSRWFAFFALTGVAMGVGLRLERRRRLIGGLLVVLPGIAISLMTFWLGAPLVVGLALVVASGLRLRAAARHWVLP